MFFAACEGYFDKLEDTAILFRNLANITHRSMGGKADIISLWPLHADRLTTREDIMKPWTQEEIKEMTERANKQFSQIPDR